MRAPRKTAAAGEGVAACSSPHRLWAGDERPDSRQLMRAQSRTAPDCSIFKWDSQIEHLSGFQAARSIPKEGLGDLGDLFQQLINAFLSAAVHTNPQRER